MTKAKNIVASDPCMTFFCGSVGSDETGYDSYGLTDAGDLVVAENGEALLTKDDRIFDSLGEEIEPPVFEGGVTCKEDIDVFALEISEYDAEVDRLIAIRIAIQKLFDEKFDGVFTLVKGKKYIEEHK